MTEKEYVVRMPTKAICLRLLNEKLTLWQNTYYSSQQNGIIAQAIEDKKMLQQAAAEMKKCLTAIQLLEARITEKEREEEQESD